MSGDAGAGRGAPMGRGAQLMAKLAEKRFPFIKFASYYFQIFKHILFEQAEIMNSQFLHQEMMRLSVHHLCSRLLQFKKELLDRLQWAEELPCICCSWLEQGKTTVFPLLLSIFYAPLLYETELQLYLPLELHQYRSFRAHREPAVWLSLCLIHHLLLESN